MKNPLKRGPTGLSLLAEARRHLVEGNHARAEELIESGIQRLKGASHEKGIVAAREALTRTAIAGSYLRAIEILEAEVKEG